MGVGAKGVAGGRSSSGGSGRRSSEPDGNCEEEGVGHHAECRVRVDKRGDVSLEGMSEVGVTRAAQVLQLLRLGQSRRAVSATAMNAESSRSHPALFVRVAATDTRTGR